MNPCDFQPATPAGSIKIQAESVKVQDVGSPTVIRRVLPESRSSLSLGHHLSPESIMALASAVFGGNGGGGPCAWAVAVGVANLNVGDRLSPPVPRTVGRLSRHLAHRIRRWSNRASGLAGSGAFTKG